MPAGLAPAYLMFAFVAQLEIDPGGSCTTQISGPGPHPTVCTGGSPTDAWDVIRLIVLGLLIVIPLATTVYLAWRLRGRFAPVPDQR